MQEAAATAESAVDRSEVGTKAPDEEGGQGIAPVASATAAVASGKNERLHSEEDGGSPHEDEKKKENSAAIRQEQHHEEKHEDKEEEKQPPPPSTTTTTTSEKPVEEPNKAETLIPAPIPAPVPTPSDQQQQNQQQPKQKLPLRSPEAAAALDRIRALQERRNQLYDRAIVRHEQKVSSLSKVDKELAEEEQLLRAVKKLEGEEAKNIAAALDDGNGGVRAQGKLEEACGGDEEREGGRADRNEDATWVVKAAQRAAAEEAASILSSFSKSGNGNDGIVGEMPIGMSIDALRERAVAANKAAANAASAALRAASASALAADAADRAIHAAQRGAHAAARAQAALDLKSVDTIEEAVRAVKEAEETAADAALQSSIGAAKAVVNEHDANRHAERSVAAGELSAPRGVGQQAAATWRQARRWGVATVKRGREGVRGGVEALRGTLEGARKGVREVVGKVHWPGSPPPGGGS